MLFTGRYPLRHFQSKERLYILLGQLCVIWSAGGRMYAMD